MSFRLISARYDDRTVPFEQSSPNAKAGASNACTVLIGRNGAGKSRLLAEICRIFAAFDDLPVVSREDSRRIHPRPLSIELSYAVGQDAVTVLGDGGRIVSTSTGDTAVTNQNRLPLPRRVIATTITPSDKFPNPDAWDLWRERSGRPSSSNDHVYRYLGGKTGKDSISTRQRLSRVADALVQAAAKSGGGRERMADVFRLVGYEPRVDVDYQMRVLGGTLVELRDAVDNPRRLENNARFDGGPYMSIVRRMRERLHNEARLHNETRKQALREALDFILSLGAKMRREVLSMSVDIEHGTFLRGSADAFRHLRVLESYRVSNLSDIRLHRKFGVDRNLALLGEQGMDLQLSVTDASSGEQAVLLTLFGIAAEIEDNSLIVIDEPEISLHPAWQEQIIPLMVSTFEGYHGCHFVIATHSPQVLARAGEVGATVVVCEGNNASVIDAAELSRKSADYQLATVFNAPGYRNEYLAREALAALQLASRRMFASPEFKEISTTLRNARAYMKSDDPVAQMIDAVLQAAQMVNR